MSNDAKLFVTDPPSLQGKRWAAEVPHQESLGDPMPQKSTPNIECQAGRQLILPVWGLFLELEILFTFIGIEFCINYGYLLTRPSVGSETKPFFYSIFQKLFFYFSNAHTIAINLD